MGTPFPPFAQTRKIDIWWQSWDNV